jgi:hypothetical protein
MSRHQTTGQNHYIMAANKSFENVKLKYLETTVSNKNYNHEEIKSRLNSGNACYIATKANGYVAKNGTSDPTILFNSQTLTSALSYR